MDSVTFSQSPFTAPTHRPSTTPLPSREDCWAEDATHTLIDAWGERYLDLNRGNLRQKHWQEVAESVNDLHCHVTGKLRSDVQCKNRIDTLKKKYKVEKARVSDSDGEYTSAWPFFAPLDALIGSTFPKPSPYPSSGDHRKTQSPAWNFSSPVPVGPRSHKRSAPVPAEEVNFRRRLSAFAEVAEAEAEVERNCEGTGGWRWKSVGERGVGYRELAKAIERFGEIYERVEGAKQRQIMELEKQRMQFTMDLEFQRMQWFMETHLRFFKFNRAKRPSHATDIYS